jgi:ATP-dependent DNA helicase RecQ
MRQQAEGFELAFPETARLQRPRPVRKAGAPIASDLLAELRAVRTRLAKAEDVPAYVVAPNRTLEQLAAERPTTSWAMARVHGMGKSRIKRFGGPFLDTIRAWTGS